jgi:hypothetical protein
MPSADAFPSRAPASPKAGRRRLPDRDVRRRGVVDLRERARIGRDRGWLSCRPGQSRSSVVDLEEGELPECIGDELVVERVASRPSLRVVVVEGVRTVQAESGVGTG